jgi:hypothetical protein
MPIWKLTPINLNDRNWAASTHKGEAIVRAESEKHARDLACLAFVIATHRVPGTTVKVIPWRLSELVTCERLEDSEYPEEGPEGVLVPEVYD